MAADVEVDVDIEVAVDVEAGVEGAIDLGAELRGAVRSTDVISCVCLVVNGGGGGSGAKLTASGVRSSAPTSPLGIIASMISTLAVSVVVGLTSFCALVRSVLFLSPNTRGKEGWVVSATFVAAIIDGTWVSPVDGLWSSVAFFPTRPAS